jgi:pSer/pThr/pTyr-binding forkhead associated (FHA) protein
MKKKNFILTVTMALFLVSCNIFEQKTFIEKIQSHPEKYKGENVLVYGYVKQQIDDSSKTTDSYILQGDKGGNIIVNTASALPETFKKYKVEGIVYISAETGMVFISEKSRVLVSGGRNMVLIMIIACLLILVVLFGVLFLTNRNRRSGSDRIITKEPIPSRPAENYDRTAMDDFKTIRIAPSSDSKTMVLIPGELKIIGGEDKGKSFRIAGYPSNSGNVVTIGREVVSGEREYAHIELKEKTVSRQQAEIIQQNGKLWLKNLSKTNLTQVDGVALKIDEMVELKPNSTIKAGEVVFQYVV